MRTLCLIATIVLAACGGTAAPAAGWEPVVAQLVDHDETGIITGAKYDSGLRVYVDPETLPVAAETMVCPFVKRVLAEHESTSGFSIIRLGGGVIAWDTSC
jgi:hypothetical protein